MGKITLFIMASMLAVSMLSSCGDNAELEALKRENQDLQQQLNDMNSAPSPESPTKTTAPLTQNTGNPSGVLGKSSVTINNAVITQDYEGKPAVVVSFDYTNNDTTAKSFLLSVLPKIFQDGVELSTTVLSYKSEYDTSSASKDIKPGITLQVCQAYQLSNTTSPIEVEVTDLYDYQKTTKVQKVLNLQ